jgi:hypothetical protein
MSEIDSNRNLLGCGTKSMLQLLALSQRSILRQLGILLASVLPQQAGAPILLSFCPFLALLSFANPPVPKDFYARTVHTIYDDMRRHGALLGDRILQKYPAHQSYDAV